MTPRLFNGQSASNPTSSLEYVFDPAQVSTDGGTTGMWRQLQPSDLGATINVSGGLSVQLGPLNVTGGSIAISNQPVVIGGGGFFGLTGIHAVSAIITGSASVINAPGTLIGVSGAFSTNTPLQAVSGQVYDPTVATILFSGDQYLAFMSGVLSRVVPVSGSLTAAAAPITPVSGLVSLVPGTTVNAQITGTPTFLLGNGIVPVSGSLTVASAPITAVSGFTTVVGGNLLPVNVSGSLTVAAAAITPVSGLVTIVGYQQELGLLSGISGLLSSNLTAPVTISDNTSWQLLSGISGVLSTNINAPAYVTGQVSIVGGSAGSSNPVGVSGLHSDLSPIYSGFPNAPYSIVPGGGRAVNVTGSLPTGYNTGDYVMFQFDQSNGALLTEGGILDKGFDNVTAWAASTGSATVPLVSGGNGLALISNPNRRASYVQNLSTGILLIGFSPSLPGTGSFNILLKGGTAVMDGNGQTWTDAPAIYTGPIAISGAVTNAQWVAWQL